MIRSTSVTGSAKPARCSSAPRSRTSANGATRGEIPPSISLSAAAKDCRSSVSVSPPSERRNKQTVGLERAADLHERARQVVDELQRQRRNNEIEDGRPNGSASSSATTKRVALRSLSGSAAPAEMTVPTERSRRAPRATRRPACRDRAQDRSGAAPQRAARRDRRRRDRAETFPAPAATARRRRARSSRRSKISGPCDGSGRDAQHGRLSHVLGGVSWAQRST